MRGGLRPDMACQCPLMIIRLRRFFFSVTFTRLIADLMFGKIVHLPAWNQHSNYSTNPGEMQAPGGKLRG